VDCGGIWFKLSHLKRNQKRIAVVLLWADLDGCVETLSSCIRIGDPVGSCVDLGSDSSVRCTGGYG
jgi:hypothetical protein